MKKNLVRVTPSGRYDPQHFLVSGKPFFSRFFSNWALREVFRCHSNGRKITDATNWCTAVTVKGTLYSKTLPYQITSVSQKRKAKTNGANKTTQTQTKRKTNMNICKEATLLQQKIWKGIKKHNWAIAKLSQERIKFGILATTNLNIHLLKRLMPMLDAK